MLRYNFNRLFKARGIEQPFTFLKRQGFSEGYAAKITTGRAKRIEPQMLERLCLAFRCTPNDLMEWEPDSTADVDTDHPLNVIRKSTKVVDITKTLNSVPLDQLDEIEALINDHIKAKE